MCYFSLFSIRLEDILEIVTPFSFVRITETVVKSSSLEVSIFAALNSLPFC
jgi:hypothetical protein